MSLRILDKQAVRRLLPYDVCMPLMRQAFTLVAERRTEQPIRQSLDTPDGRGLLSLMPGYTDSPPWLGVKIVSVFPGNFGTEFGSHQGVVMLFDVRNGAPVALLDGREVTAIRTAAATAVASDVLARADARSLAVFGYGEQAREHIEAFTHVKRIAEIAVWGRDHAKACRFAETMTARLGREIVAVAEPRQAAEADILCTTTAAAEPFLRGDWLRPGQQVSAVGSSIPSTSEIDVEVVARSRVFVDFADSARALAGDLRRAEQAGRFSFADIAGCVGDVILGRVAARERPSDITLFKSLGMICEDIVACDHVLLRAEAESIGQVVAW